MPTETVTVTTAIYWTAGDGWQPHFLAIPAGNTSYCNAIDLSDDGTVILGQAITSADNVQSSSVYCVFTNGSINTNVAPLTVNDVQIVPYRCSSDGSVILGGNSPLGYWTGSGATGHALSPISGGVATWSLTANWQFNPISHDGTIFYGDCLLAGITSWLNGTPTNYSATQYMTITSFDACGGSGDGSTVTANAALATIGGLTPGFIHLSDGTFRKLTTVGQLGSGTSDHRGITTDGSVIWATRGGNDQLYYWNDLSFVNTDGGYGVINNVTPQLMELFDQRKIARDATSPPICFGQDPSASAYYKVTGTSYTAVPPLGADTEVVVTGCSGTGAIAAGLSNSGSPNFVNTPVRWDSSLVPTALSVPAGWTIASCGPVSRDGSTILGSISTSVTFPTPPPPTPPGPPTLVTLFPSNPTSGDFFVVDESNADFPTTFGQFSISVWCCEAVTLRWPDDQTTATPFGLLEMTPFSVHAEFRDASLDLLFSGTFTNPGTAADLYQICFAIDTVAHTVVCVGNSVTWPLTSGAFTATGDIGNVA